ncbi:MFS transporter permease [Cloacibacillus porcorum]|jgi:MFS family permease|uniref:MFS transporter permease n=2 Tax=Cloacibacillus porcorum TaxID=1197717 RepID=A0A1B2I928_9BACT|nr:MFS transporter [Cloacibacillus porcorum]ANZ46437.1 MFS transporter permease [Cloacibacillus porcorum]MCC8185052.1 MFS transporter [Cloacibacillus porcorum]MDY5390435.1 MFS transporter [Cloacibacillus porcorum]NMF19321.1 MFS transporter [Cloacibacillus porcorum]
MPLTERAVSMLGAIFSSLKHRDFRIFWIGQCVSLMGTWMQRTALIWLVYTMTDSPFLVGLVGVAQFLPMLLFTLFAGAVVDRFPKRKILIVTQSLLMLQAFALAMLAFFNSEQYWQLLLLCAFLGITTTIDMPARLSFFADLVGKEDVMNAVSLNSSIVNLARIIGPAVAGIVMMKFGAAVCFLINALSFLAVIYSLTRIETKDSVAPPQKRNMLEEVKEGLAYIKNDETLYLNAVFLAIVSTFAMNSEVIIPVFAKTVLGMGAGAYTKLLSAAGAGSLAGAVTMASLSKKGVRKWILLVGAAATLSVQVLMAIAWNYALALLFVAMIGFFNLVFLNAGNSIFQVYAPDKYRGRVMSVYSFLTQGSLPVGNFFAGTAMQAFGGWAGYPACGLTAFICLALFMGNKKEVVKGWFRAASLQE